MSTQSTVITVSTCVLHMIVMFTTDIVHVSDCMTMQFTHTHVAE